MNEKSKSKKKIFTDTEIYEREKKLLEGRDNLIL
jgi:hypothetical protein